MSGAKSGPPSGESTSLLQQGEPASSPTANPLLRAWRVLPLTARVVIIILTEMALSIALNFYNSYLLRHVPGFKFPLIYTAVHMITSFIGSSILIFGVKAASASWLQFRSYWKQIVLLALLRGASITTNNWSLQYIDLPLNKVIKATAPIFTVLLSVAVERKTYSWPKVAALACLALGTALSCISTSHQQDVTGIAFALTSSVVGGSSIVVSAILLIGSSSGLGAINLLLYFAPIQTVVLFCFIPFLELRDFIKWSSDNLAGAILYILIGALLSFAFNMMGFVLVQSTSSITTAMLGNLKIVLVIVLAALLLGASAEPVNVVGYVLTILAAGSYTTVNLHERGQLPCGKRGAPAGAGKDPPPKEARTAV